MAQSVFYDEESLTRIQLEYETLVNGYWYATPENKGHEPVAYDWDQYHLLDNAQLLRLYTARDARDKLVGVALYVVVNTLHHKGYKVADCDTLATAIASRGQGIGKGLLTYAKQRLALEGVKELIHRSRLVFGEQTLFPSQGFTAIETVYSYKV